jgi:hypothetical protein
MSLRYPLFVRRFVHCESPPPFARPHLVIKVSAYFMPIYHDSVLLDPPCPES